MFSKINFLISMLMAGLSVASAEASIRGAALPDNNNERELTSTIDYRYIKAYSGDKKLCWEAAGDYYLYAKKCDYGDDAQQWYYTKYGELTNKYWGGTYCLTNDIDFKYYVIKRIQLSKLIHYFQIRPLQAPTVRDRSSGSSQIRVLWGGARLHERITGEDQVLKVFLFNKV